MMEPQANSEKKLEEQQEKLIKSSSIQQTITALEQIKNILTPLTIQDISNVKDFMIKHLKPISRQVTNINLKLVPHAHESLQDLMLVIFILYADSAKLKLQASAFEIVWELLNRSTQLLMKPEDDQNPIAGYLQKRNQLQLEWEWIMMKTLSSERNTFFFYKCINSIMQRLSGIETTFSTSGFSFIKQFINFATKMSTHLKLSKILLLCQRISSSLENIMISAPTNKQFNKQLTLESIRSLSAAGVKLADQYRKYDFKKRFEMLASLYGLSLLGMSSIQKKINGLKIINKQAQQFYKSSQTSVKQDDYGAWILDNKVIQMILEEATQSPILKNCNYIFRILFRKRSVGRQILGKILKFIEQTNTENRQLLLKYIEYESLRFQYSDYQLYLQTLKVPHKQDFYQEDTFTLCIQFTRYSSSRLIKQYLQVLQNLLKTNFGKFKNQKVQFRCLKSYVRTAICLFDRQTAHQNKKKQLLKIYDNFIGQQFNQLGILVLKSLFEQLPEMSDFSKSKIAMFLIQTRKPIQMGFAQMQRCSQNICLKHDIESLINLLLKCTQDYYGQQKLHFPPQILLQSVHSVSIFSKLSSLMLFNQQMLDVFEKLLSKFKVENFSFDCLKYLFYRINYAKIRQIKNYGFETQYQIKCNVEQLKGYESLKYLMLNANSAQNRDRIADFMSDLHTHYEEQRTIEGEFELQKIMQQTLQLTINEYKQKQSLDRLLGYLSFVQQLMMATQVLGTGKYQPHNSLVPISTIQVKVHNDVTYGNDVSQSYQKKVPANLTFFQLLTQLGQKFRCPSCQIILQQSNFQWPQKWNGLTLQQLKIDGKVLKAVKSPKDKIRKYILLQNNELTQKAKKVFQQIYNMFAVDGKMGKKQCSNFVAGVTKTSSSPYQGRVVQFFKDFDSDQDDNITLQDFLRFYKQNCVPSRDDVVWKNLSNMRYRRDLKKYHDPVQLTNQNLLFRSWLYKSIQFYDMLFFYSESQNKQLEERSKRLLLRLPTFPKTLESVHSELNLIQKNCFQTEYLLIAIQSKLNAGDQQSMERQKNRKQFIQSGNAIQIFQMMIRIDKMTNATQYQKKCLIISLQILRSLLKVPDLRNNIQSSDSIQYNLRLPQTDLFNKLSSTSFKNVEIQILQAALVLQFTQQKSSIDLALQGIFHQQIGIRKICCNFVFISYVNKKVDVDLFKIQQKMICQYWFQVLTKICLIDKKINFGQIIKNSLQILKTRKQTIQKIVEDPIIYGNLNIIYSILKEEGAYKFPDISSQLIEISQNVISGRSRHLIYSILSSFDINYTVTFIIDLIDSVQPMKQIQHKKFYVGLKNLGNTCYMNSALQVLFFNQQFKNIIMNLPKKQLQISQVNGKKIYDDTLYQLQKMYSYFTKSIKKYYNPQQFCMTFKKPGTNEPIDTKLQEDAHEFVGKFLDKIQKKVQNPQIIQSLKQVLQGKTITQIQCKTCLNKISRQQTFCQLPLSVQKLDKLEQSFATYILPEEISEYYCQRCEKKVQKISKATFLSKLPKLLIINLQRIIYDLQELIQKKIDTTFQFPENLDVSDYILKDSNINKEDCNYRLKGVIIHSGTSESGHYYSIIRIDNEWYKFNDQNVTRFDIKNLPHQAFGGAQSKQQWGDQLKFSTNAYILFYEKVNEAELEPSFKLEQYIIQQIQKDNQKFYKQLQVHQQSIFVFADELFEKYQPVDIQEKMKTKPYDQKWNEDSNLQYYQAIYQLSMRVLKFATSYYDVKSNLIFKVGQNLFKLFYLLPEKSYPFITEISPDQCIQNLCLHPQDTIRNVYKYLLNKSMHVFNCYYQLNFESQEPGVTQFIKLIDCLFAFLEDQRLMKNIAKSYPYFQFWKTNCEYIPSILEYLAQHQMMAILGDLLMGNDSPFADKKKKRTQIPQIYSMPLIQTILFISSRKKNLKNSLSLNKGMHGVSFFDMSEKEIQIYGNINFYSKMAKSKRDNGLLGFVISRLSQGDQDFSKAIVPIFLRGLNNLVDIEVAITLLNYLRYFLLVNDELTVMRLKWVLGIPQLRMSTQQIGYGLSYEDESLAFEYVSPLCFGKNQKQQMKPALTVLYENHQTFNKFSASGITLLLQLMNSSQKAFEYVMGLPAPTYLYPCYLDWVSKYIQRFKDNFNEELRNEKQAIYEKLSQMYDSLVEKADGLDLPINKTIIGRNKQLEKLQQAANQVFKMTLWSHCTYILPNAPLIYSNKSLPKDLFKFANPTGFAKYFVTCGKADNVQKTEEIQSQLTVYTLEIKSTQKLKLKFKLQKFREQIYTSKGTVFINFPYQHIDSSVDYLMKIVEVSVMKEDTIPIAEQSKMTMQQIAEAPAKQEMDYYNINQSQMIEGIACRSCTLINGFEQIKCTACGADLYS